MEYSYDYSKRLRDHVVSCNDDTLLSLLEVAGCGGSNCCYIIHSMYVLVLEQALLLIYYLKYPALLGIQDKVKEFE
jgi:hypothetical protein